jgi:hypothetical protein
MNSLDSKKIGTGHLVMNERIKQIAEQAGYLPDNFGIGHWDMPECKKFAELIIAECADVANKNRTAMEMDRNTHLAADAIKKHFGVE